MTVDTWQKSISRLSRSFLWMAGGAILVVLALTGLCALAPVDDAPRQAKFFISLFLYLVFEIGLVAFNISFNCWLNLKLHRHEPIASESLTPKSDPILFRPGQETGSNEQYA